MSEIENENCLTCIHRKGAARRGKECSCDYPTRNLDEIPAVEDCYYEDIQIGVDSEGKLFPYRKKQGIKIVPITYCPCYDQKRGSNGGISKDAIDAEPNSRKAVVERIA